MPASARRRRWLLVALGLPIALAAALYATHTVSLSPPGLEVRDPDSAAAKMRVLVDTPRSLVGTSRTVGDDTIAERAALLGSLLATDGLEARVAQGAGVDPADLTVTDAALANPLMPTPLSRGATEATATRGPISLTIDTPEPEVPIVSLVGEAPSIDQAKSLVSSAANVLVSLGPGRTAAGGPAVDIRPLGRPAAEEIPAEPNGKVAVVVFVAVFVVWVLAVALFEIANGRRRRRPRRFDVIANGNGNGAAPSLARRPGPLNGHAPQRLGRSRSSAD